MGIQEILDKWIIKDVFVGSHPVVLQVRLAGYLSDWHPVLIQVPDALLLIQLPTIMPRKAAGDGSRAWALHPCGGSRSHFDPASPDHCGHLGK